MVSFYNSYYNYAPSINLSRIKLISLKIDYKTIPFHYGASESNIALKRMTPVKCTKYQLDKLVLIRENRKKTDPKYINEVILNKFLFKETSRCVLQLSLIDSISTLVEPTNSDSVISFVLGTISNINTFHDLNFHCLKIKYQWE